MINLAAQPLRVIDAADRRILGAFQLVDAVTRLPINRAVTVRTLDAVLVRPGPDIAVPVTENSARIRQNQSGIYIVLRAPFFDDYTNAFTTAQNPPETDLGPLRLRLGVAEQTPSYLPQAFSIDLPRSLDPNDANTVFDPVAVALLRSPSAPVQHGWAVLRVRVTETGSDPINPLPGVLVRVFRSPRAAEDEPIGLGMTDWRGSIRGEALVPITGINRFRPGAGDTVIETEVPVVVEAARHVAFTGATDQFPDLEQLLADIPQDLNAAPGPGLGLLRPPDPVLIRAGRTLSMGMSMS